MESKPADLNTRWEDHEPVYRVDFWTFTATHAGDVDPDVTPYSSEWDLTEARDVNEVVAWAEDNVREWLAEHPDRPRTYVVYVVRERGEASRGLIRIFGED